MSREEKQDAEEERSFRRFHPMKVMRKKSESFSAPDVMQLRAPTLYEV